MSRTKELKGSYYGIPLSAMKIVTDETSVRARMEELLDSVSWRAVSDEICMGDKVHLTYAATVAGLPFPGSSSKDSVVTIGSGERIDGFDDALIGHKVADSVSFKLRFPDFHAVRAYEGQTCNVDARILRVQRKVAYELTDEYVRSVSDFSSVQELYDEIYWQMDEENSVEERRFLQSQIEEALAALVSDEAVAGQMVQELALAKTRLQDEAQRVGVSYEEYLGDALDNPEEVLSKAVEVEVKVAYAVKAIQSQEEIVVPSSEVDDELERMKLAMSAGSELADEVDLRNVVCAALAREKVFDFVVRNAVFENDVDE